LLFFAKRWEANVSIRGTGAFILRAGALAIATFAAGTSAQAQTASYPDRNITFICAFPAGSGSDTLVRYFAEKLRPLAGRTILVENRFGASGNIATEYTARAKPDGYTIYVHAGSAVAANMHLFKKPPVEAGKAIEIIATLNRQAFMVAVDASKPWKTLDDLTAFLKTKGDKATYATSASTGTVMGEIYKQKLGLQALEVVYRVGQDSLNDQLGGKIDYGMFDPVYTMIQVRAGRLRALAVSTGARLEANPDIPTMTELGVPMDLTGWFAAMGPTGIPKPIVEKLNGWFKEILVTPETKEFLNKFGGDPFINTPEQAQVLFQKELKDWADYVKLAKIEPQ
jgi:tripartite-type tricarboxylate transporter receptor subunit TctC